MKIFRAHTSFSPQTIIDMGGGAIVILPKTDYEIVDTNQAFGIYIKIPKFELNTLIHNSSYITPEEIKQYGEVQNELTANEIIEILHKISFVDSCIDFNWGWEVTEVNGKVWKGTDEDSCGEIFGFLINTTFQRPDTNTGLMGTGKGRRMWIESTASETSVVMTAWVCIELIIKHETMEAVKYAGAKILNPHKTLEQLAFPEKLNK